MMFCSVFVSRLLRTIVKTEAECGKRFLSQCLGIANLQLLIRLYVADPALSQSLSLDEWDLLKSIIQEEDPIPSGTYAGKLANVADSITLAGLPLVSSVTSSELFTASVTSGTADTASSELLADQLANEAAKVAEVVAESHTKACEELESFADETGRGGSGVNDNNASPFNGITTYLSTQYEQFIGSATVQKWARVETFVGIGLGLVIGTIWNRYNSSLRIQKQDAKIQDLLSTVWFSPVLMLVHIAHVPSLLSDTTPSGACRDQRLCRGQQHDHSKCKRSKIHSAVR
jgi:hypothetical protein